MSERDLGKGADIEAEGVVGLVMHAKIWVRGGGVEDASSSSSSASAAKFSPRKSEYSPRKFALVGSSTKKTRIPRPVSRGLPTVRFSLDGGRGTTNIPKKKRDRAKSLPQTRVRAQQSPHQKGQKQRERHARNPQTLRRGHHAHEQEEGDDDDNIPRAQLAVARSKKKKHLVDRGEISVDELKKRLSQLIDISLTELEKLFDAP
jgi:hypothetical protein